MAKSNLWRGLTSAFALLFSLTLFGQSLAFTREGDVNLFLGTLPPVQTVTEDTNYFPSDFASADEMRAAVVQHVIDTQIEGSVLLRNENGALPFDSSAKVTLFGFAAATPVYHGGSGGPANTGINLADALKAEGVSVNDTVMSAITAAGGSRTKTGLIGEIPASSYNGTEASFKEYSDAAIYVMSRYGGEEGDLNHGLQGEWQEGPAGIRELALHPEEIDTLKLIQNAGFKKIIVVVNSGYAMELGELPEYGVESILWIGYPGGDGMKGVAQVLTGKADPSGRNVITYAANSLSSASMQNAGDFTFSNLTGLYKNKYLVYAEGIYVGYKYYETRYHDAVLGIHNADSAKGAYVGDTWNYADEMVYSFGDGMSYAEFNTELESLEWNRDSHTVSATVKVTNLGGFAGKSKTPVQLYVSQPWEEGMAEKSAIQLVDFGKSSYLASGESETVTLECSDYIFATYDQNAVNGADSSRKGSYVFDAGDYYFSVGNGAHDALNNVLAAKGAENLIDADGNTILGNAANVVKVTLDATDNTTYAVSPYTGEVVANRFEDRDVNYFIPGTVTYMTRGDWNTFPDTVSTLTATDEIKNLMENFQYVKPADAPDISTFTYKADNGISFIDMKDVPFEDTETWDKFIDQLTVSELAQIVGDKMGLDNLSSVDFPAYAGGDGPDGYQSGGVLYGAEMLAASTFNKELIAERGYYFGEESFWIGFRHTYAPGGNIHRTPYSGRNFEYYSEDAIMSYICGELQTTAMAKKGLAGMFKHFCGNDQETNRHGVATFMTEQTYREVCLKGFEGGLSKDHSLGTMTAYNRIGCIPTASDYETMTGVLRNEWGFTGINMTDSSKDSASYMGTGDALRAGTNQFNNDPGRVAEASNYLTKERDGFIWSKLRSVAKYYLYSMSRSNLINGLSKEVAIEDFTPWWKPTVVAINVGIGVLTAASLAMYVISSLRAKKEEK